MPDINKLFLLKKNLINYFRKKNLLKDEKIINYFDNSFNFS